MGSTIRRGEKVTVWYSSANRDEAVFDRPFTFDICRKNAGKHVSFGYGIHHCLGAALARMEISILFQELLKHLEGSSVSMVGELGYLRSNRHQGVSEMKIRID